MANMADVVNDDAFGVTTLTQAFLEQDHVPGRAGQLVFQSAGEGIQTLTAAFEWDADTITVIPTGVRGGPANEQDRSKRKLVSLPIPYIPLRDRIHASEVQGIRAMGTSDAVQTVRQKLDGQLRKMGLKHDMTAENLRMGALLGKVYDADGTELYDLFSTFGKTQETAINFALTTASTEVRTRCAAVIRKMKANAKTMIPGTGHVHAFCGDNFFDALLGHASVKGAYDGYGAAERRLGESYVHGIYEFGGIYFENYRGADGVSASANTEDGGAVGIDPDECRFFWVGVPGIYAEYYAPGNFVDTVGSTGLPRYASVALDPYHGQFIDVHTEQSPLPVCTRPLTLMKGAKA